jgi:hypothetical protein
MRVILAAAVLALACGCGTSKGSGTTSDAMQQADAVPDSPGDAPADDARADVRSDTVRPDAGVDAGPIACGANLNCQGTQYCVPECCSPCFSTDGGACPAGATLCAVGATTGCNYCTPASGTGTIPGDCTPGGGDPRRLSCRCN